MYVSGSVFNQLGDGFKDFMTKYSPDFASSMKYMADTAADTAKNGGFMDFLKNSFTGDDFKNLVDLGGLYSAINQ